MRFANLKSELVKVYIYDEIDQRMVDERVAQFRDQTRRFLAGSLSEDDFRPLRLQNGLYIQRYAPMLRVAIPYGLLASRQLRALAYIARNWDRGYGHFSTRQNIQFNWPKLEDVPDILAKLATVQMHAIQTSGNCIRNTTTDHFAGVAPDEIVDPLVWCEMIRQWSAFHPEFAYLPRKFKIAVSGARAGPRGDPGARHRPAGAAGRDGQRRVSACWSAAASAARPIIGTVIREFLPWQHLLTYLDAILRVYNRYGRRDNKYKARIKILVKELTPEVFRAAGRGRVGASQGRSGHADPEHEVAAHRARASRGRPTRNSIALASGYTLALGARQGVCQLGAAQRAAAQGGGLRRRHAVAEKNRRAAGRRHRRADGCGGGSRRPLQLRRTARVARAESDSGRRAAVRSARAVAGGDARWGSPRPTSGC